MLQKDNNPYTGLLGLMRTHGSEGNPTVYAIGQVVSTSPLKVKVGGIELDEEDLRINADLLKGYKRKLKLTGDICTCEGVGSSGGGDSGGTGDGDTGGDSGEDGGSSAGGSTETGGSSGGGDMTMAVYDTNGSGVVDDAEKLGGYSPEYYARAEDVPKLTTAYSVVIKAAGWNGNTQTIAVDGISASDDLVIGYAAGLSEEQIEAAANGVLDATGQSAGSITITARGEAPTVDIPIVVIRVGIGAVHSLAVTLNADEWDGNTQTVAVAGLTGSDNVQVGYGILSEAQVLAAEEGMLVATGQSEGSITITAHGEVPDIDIPLIVMIMG